jgi:hypothetical protein
MSDQARERKLGVTRYEPYQSEIRRGSARRADGPHPREYDANGFPVPQHNASFVERVARLLNAV